jgi:hypothetical protein
MRPEVLMPIRVLAALVLLAGGETPPAQLVLHVTDGPLEPGAERAPDLPAALERLAAARAAGDGAPVTILLGDGAHRVERPIALTPELVAEGLTLSAAPGCSPTISGGRVIEGLEAHADGTWRAVLEDVRDGRWWFEELFADGRRATRARHPDAGYARVAAAAPDNRTGFRFDPAELPPALLDGRAEVVLLHDWSTSRVRVTAVDAEANSLTTTHPIGCKAPHYAITNFEPHPRFFVEGSPLLADAPGEWALDRESGELVYRPLPGERLGESRLVAPYAPALLRAEGEPARPLEHLTLRGVRFAHASWPIPEYGYAEGQAAFYERRDREGSDGTRDAVPAALELAWARGCAIERCTVESVGGGGVWLGPGCRDCTITDCVIRDTGANGVMLGEGSGRQVDGRPWWQSAPAQVASGNRLQRSLVERCGRRFFGAVGVWIGLAEETVVEHCELRELPYTGVSVGWRWDETPTPCRANRVEGNHIHHVMQTLSDGGGIYTLGYQPGTVLRGNAIHDVPANAGRAPSNGIFLDQGTSGLLVEDNAFWAIDTTPLRWHWTYANTVRGNTFFQRPGQRVARYNRARPEDISYELNDTPPAEAAPGEAARAVIEDAGPRR